MNELRFARRTVRFGVIETMHTNLDGAVTLHLMGFQRAGDEFAPHVASADVLLDAFRQFHFAEGYSALVMIKLDVIGKKRGKFLQVTSVVSVKERGVQGGDGFIEFRLGFNVLERRNAEDLGVCSSGAQRQYTEYQQYSSHRRDCRHRIPAFL